MAGSLHRKARLYLAAPLFNPREREFNNILTGALQDYFDVFLPQRDGLLLTDIVARGISTHQAEKMVFDADIASMQECDCLLAVLDGSNIDEGVAFEIGYMFALGRVCVALQTDVRRQLPTGNNPMIKGSVSKIFRDTSAILEWARAFDSEFEAV
jgi:nucleoside 2-deoxyribosyltransferase